MDPDPELQAEIERFEEQYAENPDGLVFARLADLYRKAGNVGLAMEVVDKGLEHHPQYTSGHLVRGRCLRDEGEDAAARDAFEQVLELDQQNLVALRELAELARQRGDRQTAREHLEALLEVDSGNEEAREMLEELGGGEGPAPAGEPPPPEAEEESGEDAGQTMKMDRSELERLHQLSPEDEGSEDEGEDEEWDDVFSAVDEAEGEELPDEAEIGPLPGEEEEAAGLEELEDELSAAGEPEAREEEAEGEELPDEAEIGPLPGEEEEAAGLEELEDELSAAGEVEEPDAGPDREPEGADTAEWSAPDQLGEADEETAAGEAEEHALDEAEDEELPDEAEIGPLPGEAEEAAGPEEPEELQARIEELAPDVEGGEADPDAEEDLATETLAELYEAQGFYRQAVEMYEELLEERPDDRDLEQRLERAREALEAQDVPEETEAAPPPSTGGPGDGEEELPEEEGDEPPPPPTAREQLQALLRGEAVPDAPGADSGGAA